MQVGGSGSHAWTGTLPATSSGLPTAAPDPAIPVEVPITLLQTEDPPRHSRGVFRDPEQPSESAPLVWSWTPAIPALPRPQRPGGRGQRDGHRAPERRTVRGGGPGWGEAGHGRPRPARPYPDPSPGPACTAEHLSGVVPARGPALPHPTPRHTCPHHTAGRWPGS